MVKERIIEAAKELFQQTGLKNTTMDDIARQAGISKRTIYENFKDKEEILIACIELHIAENKRFAKTVFDKSDNVLEGTLSLLKKGNEQMQKHQFLLTDEIKRYYPAVHKSLVMCRSEEKVKEMEKFVKQGMSEGIFREDLNPEIVAVLFHRQAEGIGLNDQNLDRFSVMEVFENMILSYLRGLCTPKGLEILDKALAKTQFIQKN
ncbi:MAG: TetR/AcrR family transcriptional regulator [Bacteroidales bacterium]|nr:TetR/AcrR family transcriptional regulator [Bacteroidales bacterium]